MNHSSLCRLIVSSTFRGVRDALHGGILRNRYHYCRGLGETPPFTLIEPWLTTTPLSEEHLIPVPTSYKILGPGMILLRKYISIKDQIDIVHICEKWGVRPGGFDMPGFSYGADIRQHMCFGRNWDPETRYNNPHRRDGSEPIPVPSEFTSLAQTAIQDARAHLDDDQQLPSMSPDTCSVSFYPLDGQLGLHQDCDESSDSLERGLPVVSISIGETADFLYGHTTDENKLERVKLRSGDVLIFGGKSRLIYHAVNQIGIYTAPTPLLRASGFRTGRLNLTLKQF